MSTLNLQNIQITQDDSSTKEEKTQDKRNCPRTTENITNEERRETPPRGREGGQNRFIRDRPLEQTNRATNLDVY